MVLLMTQTDLGVIGNFLNWVRNPFLSDYISATTTILAGLLALIVYWKQKSDKRRAAAKLVYHEIIYADQIAKSAGEIEGIKYHLRLLPSQNWHLNKHLFTSQFNREELELIDVFYARGSDIDRLMDAISQQLNGLPSSDLSSMNARIAAGEANVDGTTVKTHQRIAWLKKEIVDNSLIGTTVLQTLDELTLSKLARVKRRFR